MASQVLTLIILLLCCPKVSGQSNSKEESSGTPDKQPPVAVEEGRFALVLQGLLQHSVPEVGVDALAGRTDIVVLDAREPEEYSVSHLPGARYVGYEQFDLNRMAGISRDAELVVYCSVGYRSEKVAEMLLEAGYTRVSNLYGGLFEWVNQGYPVVDQNEKPTRRVHAYNRNWGLFLERGEKVYGE